MVFRDGNMLFGFRYFRKRYIHTSPLKPISIQSQRYYLATSTHKIKLNYWFGVFSAFVAVACSNSVLTLSSNDSILLFI